MNRTLKLSMLMALTLGSTQAMALGLGQIRVKSALDRPLVAEIPLIADYPGEANNVQVSLASAQDFARAGLDRSRFPADLTFKVVTDAHGHKFIRVTSAKPIRETYLDFLIQVEWPRGQLLREFTVLLDPPHMASAAPAPSVASGHAAAAPHPHVAPARHASGGAAGGGTGARVAHGRYGPVRRGETLSEIARKTAPSGVTMNQMLVAMYRANHDAFYRANMNALKRGAVLRIPSRSQAESTSAAAALADVRRQYQDWKGMAAKAPTMVARTGGSNRASSHAGTSGAGDHLKLVPPKQGGGASGHGGVRGGTGNANIAGLRQDLARARESLGNLKQESQDLKTRVSDLRKINSKNQRLLSLKNAEIAELQQKLADARKAAGMPPAKPGAPTMTSAPAAAASASKAAAPVAMPAGAASVASANQAAKTAPAAAASAAKATPKPVASKQPTPSRHKPVPVQRHRAIHPAPAEAPWYMQTWSWIAGGAVVVLLALLGFARGRKSSKPEAPRSSLADQFGESPLPASGDEGMDEEQSDLLAELAENPDDVGLHLELVSLYFERRDVEHFEAAAEAMYAHVSDPDQAEWQEVRAMGEELAPEHPLFAAAKGDDEAVQAGAAEDTELAPGFDAPEAFDIDSFMADQDDDAIIGSPEPMAESGSKEADLLAEGTDEADAAGREHAFDFDLTPGASTDEEATSMPSEDEFDSLPPLPEDEDAGLPYEHATEAAGEGDSDLDVAAAEDEALPEDPVDTKLDLARAYLDMGDPDGARSMLEEVMAEGTQMQKDVAQKLLDEIG